MISQGIETRQFLTKNEALKNPPKIPGENSTGRNAGEKGKLAGCDYKEAFVC